MSLARLPYLLARLARDGYGDALASAMFIVSQLPPGQGAALDGISDAESGYTLPSWLAEHSGGWWSEGLEHALGSGASPNAPDAAARMPGVMAWVSGHGRMPRSRINWILSTGVDLLAVDAQGNSVLAADLTEDPGPWVYARLVEGFAARAPAEVAAFLQKATPGLRPSMQPLLAPLTEMSLRAQIAEAPAIRRDRL